MSKFWLLKAEPISRVVKGKDVKFSVDDFEAVGTTAWEGVRNPEAKGLMMQMKVGDKALFYHSNCPNPGIAAFAEVAKEAYPDHTAWDPTHPYYDAKTDQNSPKWYMVDLKFTGKLDHFIPLSLVKYISTLDKPPSELSYIGEEGVRAIKLMDLTTRGRLSIQRVDPKAYETIILLAQTGGWDSLDFSSAGKRTPKTKTTSYKEVSSNDEFDEPISPVAAAKKSGGRGRPRGGRASAASKRKKYAEEDEFDEDELDSESDFDGGADDDDYGSSSKKGRGKKRKAPKRAGDEDGDYRASRPGKRRSTRA